MKKTVERIFEMLVSGFRILLCADPIPVHLRQLIACIGIFLRRRTAVETERLPIALLYTLAAVVQSGQRILRVFMVGGDRLPEPPNRRLIVLFCAKTYGIHLSDTVLQIGAQFLFDCLLRRLKSDEGLGVPFLRGSVINLPTKTVRIHPAEVVHGQRVAGFRFLPE